MENPDDPAGPPYFKFTVYSAQEKSKHSKKLEFDACKNKDGVMDFSLEDLDFGLDMKETGKSLRAIADKARSGHGHNGGSSNGNASGQSSGSGQSGGAVTQAQVVDPGPGTKPKPLPIEDAKEKDKLMLKVEEATRGCSTLLLKAAKAQANLPTTGTGKRSKAMLAEAVGPVEIWEPKLKHMAIHGCWPGHSEAPAVQQLSQDLKEFAAAFDDLKQALEVAAPLLKAKKEEKA